VEEDPERDARVRRVRAPLSIIILVAIAFGISLWMLMLLTGFVEVEGLLTDFITFIVNLVILTILAVLLASAFGMFVSLGILTRGRSTPFENSMLDMKERFDRLDRKLCRLGRRQCEMWPDEPGMPGPGQVATRVPASFHLALGAIVLLIAWMALLLSRVVVLDWSLELQFIGFTSMLVVLTIGAVVGAFFFGLFLGHRLITGGSFTPFETSILEMNARLARMERHMALLGEEIEKEDDERGGGGNDHPHGNEEKGERRTATAEGKWRRENGNG